MKMLSQTIADIRTRAVRYLKNTGASSVTYATGHEQMPYVTVTRDGTVFESDSMGRTSC